MWYKVVGTIDTSRESSKAILVNITELDGKPFASSANTWFPKSQVKDIEYQVKNDDGNLVDTFLASDWICDQKNLFYGIDG